MEFKEIGYGKPYILSDEFEVKKPGKMGERSLKEWFSDAAALVSNLFVTNVKAIEINLRDLHSKETKILHKLANPHLSEKTKNKLISQLVPLRQEIYQLEETKEKHLTPDQRIQQFVERWNLEILPALVLQKEDLKTQLNVGKEKLENLRNEVLKHEKKHPEYKRILQKFVNVITEAELVVRAREISEKIKGLRPGEDRNKLIQEYDAVKKKLEDKVPQSQDKSKALEIRLKELKGKPESYAEFDRVRKELVKETDQKEKSEGIKHLDVHFDENRETKQRNLEERKSIKEKEMKQLQKDLRAIRGNPSATEERIDILRHEINQLGYEIAAIQGDEFDQYDSAVVQLKNQRDEVSRLKGKTGFDNAYAELTRLREQVESMETANPLFKNQDYRELRENLNDARVDLRKYTPEKAPQMVKELKKKIITYEKQIATIEKATRKAAKKAARV